MADRRNAPLVNFANGEWSPLMAARVDSPDYNKSLKWCQNFIPLPQGGLRYRTGTLLGGLTNGNGSAYLIPFQFSAQDAIMIEATDLTFRFYRNGAPILNTLLPITGITRANPGVVTAAAHGYSNGQQVYISGVWGMPQVNDQFFTVAGATTNTFQLQDPFGNPINTTNYGAWTANGTVGSVYTLVTPYAIADLPTIRWAQVGDVMYIVHPNYAPEKLVRSGFTNWTLGTFSRTNDPFSGFNLNITGITKAIPAVVTVASTSGMLDGDQVTIKGVSGMTQVNHKTFIIHNITGTTFALYDSGGNPIDSTHYNAYVSGGVVNDVNNWPACVAFTSDGRLAYANSHSDPLGLWGSELPTGTTTNYDNFSTGTAANDAYAYQFAPIDGIVDAVQEMKSFGGMLSLLGSTAIQQVFGAQPGTPPNPTAIGTTDTVQGSAKVRPIAVNQNLLFVDANQKKLRGLQFNFYFSNYQPIDFSKDSQHLGEESPFIKLVHMKGVPEIVWCLRADGVLLSFTFNNTDPKDPQGYTGAWARHYIGGGAQVIDISTIRDASGNDKLYLSVQRTLTSVVYNTIEILSEKPAVPLRRSFFTGDKTADQLRWEQATWEQAKLASFLDMTLGYDGRERGNQALATVTPSATTGNGITLTASAAVFQPSDVGAQLWKFYNPDGSGGGMARITAYTDSTHVTADVVVDFDNTNAIAAGSWAFAVEQIDNLQLFAGQTLKVEADGASHPSVVVAANGSATLQWPVSIAQFGFSYAGLASTQNLDLGGPLGPSGSKPRNVKKVGMRVTDSIGGMVGTSEYALKPIFSRQANSVPNRPPAPFTGSVDTRLLDTWSNDTKECVIFHNDPTPLTVLGLDIEMVSNEAP